MVTPLDHGSSRDHPKSGHFTCSRERTDHVLPTDGGDMLGPERRDHAAPPAVGTATTVTDATARSEAPASARMSCTTTLTTSTGTRSQTVTTNATWSVRVLGPRTALVGPAPSAPRDRLVFFPDHHPVLAGGLACRTRSTATTRAPEAASSPAPRSSCRRPTRSPWIRAASTR